MVSLKKIKIVEKISEELQNSNSFLVFQFTALKHQQLEEIRKAIKKLGKIKVVKNSLYEKAINKNLNNKPILYEVKKRYLPLREKNAVVFFKEVWDEGVKKIYAFIKKDYPIKFKFAVLDKVVYDENGLIQLAQLPSKEELVAKIIGAIKSPVYRLYQVSINPIQKLIYIFQQQAKKGGETG